ncbi:glycoside hydrolase family 65 protein [Hydromonas duriensis]|uniref:Alpha,alpha-trehalose phosphorylase n=1 Tax=Hydromonas duriensis TaxID=1527608 RepID=A0A4R6Y6A9_9BURK|nr:glycosyl hydrolase family 65 protein [Hydromonas duriensis]TDR31139.1 alpha,alpha-trehalose phosphorylase [Hydromonas duriensis]
MHHNAQHSSHSHIAVEPWGIRESSFDSAQAALHETLFCLGNGQIGVRGAQEEGELWAGTMQNDVFINGFYESEPIVYPEAAYGFAHTNQFIVRVPNVTGMTFSIDGIPFDANLGRISDYSRQLDFQTGVLTRSFVWTSPSGQKIRILSERLVSFTHMSIVAVRYALTPLNFTGDISITSSITNLPRALMAGDDPRVGASLGGSLDYIAFESSEDFAAFTHGTHHSDLKVVSSVTHDQTPTRLAHDEQQTNVVFAKIAEANQAISVVKFGAYITSQTVDSDDMTRVAKHSLDTAKTIGFDGLVAEQEAYLNEFWLNANVEIGGDDSLQQGMRFGQFHLLQSAGRDGKTNIAAKGVTGAGYDGHYFWDTEIYVLPFFLHTRPDIARRLLEYRASTLDAARARAREMSHTKGALYPWRTITGPECSSYFPAGTAQYHINADIAYAVRQYNDVTDDRSFLLEHGAEMVFETTRIWPALGRFDEQGQFGIYTVTGPDEYTALVNNNLFTNAMARHHLQYAVNLVAWLSKDHPEKLHELRTKIDLTSEEIAIWQDAAAHMKMPFDAKRGIHAQDDAFFEKPLWDFANTPRDKYPLLLNFHPLVIYRHQVCKQPDVVLALLLLGHEFSVEQKKRNYDYYEAITTHDSSLSSCIFSIMAAEVGYTDKAYDYFMQTARLDVDNLHHNTQHGVHAAALAGSWMSVVYGFAGLRTFGKQVKFSPFLPKQWTHYQFNVRIKNCLLQVRIDKSEATYRLLEGATLDIEHKGMPVQITAAQDTVVRI